MRRNIPLEWKKHLHAANMWCYTWYWSYCSFNLKSFFFFFKKWFFNIRIINLQFLSIDWGEKCLGANGNMKVFQGAAYVIPGTKSRLNTRVFKELIQSKFTSKPLSKPHSVSYQWWLWAQALTPVFLSSTHNSPISCCMTSGRPPNHAMPHSCYFSVRITAPTCGLTARTECVHTSKSHAQKLWAIISPTHDSHLSEEAPFLC